MSLTIEIKVFKGIELQPYLQTIAHMRIKMFASFPYLYVGERLAEDQYLEGFLRCQNSLLVVAVVDGSLAGICLGTPLSSPAKILGEVPSIFTKEGLDPSRFFYVADVLVEPLYRGKRIAMRMLECIEEVASNLGFDKFTFATVERDSNHPQQPADYVSNDHVWLRSGYRPMEVKMMYPWKSLLDDGSVRELDHLMKFWLKP